MTRFHKLLTQLAIAGAAGLLLHAGAQDQAPPSLLNVGANGHTIHILPPVQTAQSMTGAATDNGPLVYHSGGVVMQPSVTTYVIYWTPSKLQNGSSTSLTSHYESVQNTMLADYFGHGIDNNNTQYYQKSGTATTYIQNKGNFGGAFVDTAAYPKSSCNDSVTPGNCITDAEIQAEVKKVMAAHKLTGGLNKIFMVYTSKGEGSCFDSSSSACSYAQYCAYHSYFNVGSTPVVYSNEPYGDPNYCQIPGVPSPNGDLAADTASTAASHELTEAITDPKLNAWFTAQGNEIGDLCAYKYGSATWDGGKATQMWNGHFYFLQPEYDNHTKSCAAVGP